jgi:tetratricopeptide (TPR) repeat protein
MVTKAAIATGHPDHAPAAMVDLGALLKQQSQSRPRRQARGRLEAAETAYRDAIATRHANYAPAAMYNLGNLLAERGRLDEAEAAFRDAIATGDPAASALAERALGILSKR